MIIFICKNDPFKAGLQKYTFRTSCLESVTVDLNDMSLKLIYNASAWKKEKDEKIKSFLKFVSRNKASDDFTGGLLKSVDLVKRNETFRKEYLSMGIWETDIRETALQQGMQQGLQEKAIEAARNALNMGLSIEQAAQITSLPIEEVKQLAQKLGKEALQL